jgi:hypothetical protein
MAVHCRDARLACSLQLDGELNVRGRERLARHLRCCGSCRSVARDLDAISKLLRAGPRRRLHMSHRDLKTGRTQRAFRSSTADEGTVDVGGGGRPARGTRLSTGAVAVSDLLDARSPCPPPKRVGFANSGGLVFVDESAEEVAAAEASGRAQRRVAAVGRLQL